jgi:hypothetical protein
MPALQQGLRIMHLVDTTINFELRQKKPQGTVVAWLQSVDDKDLYLASGILTVIQAGIELTREQDAECVAELEI